MSAEQKSMIEKFEERLQSYDINRIANLQRPEVKFWLLNRLGLYHYHSNEIIPLKNKIKYLKNKKMNEDLDHDTMMELSYQIRKLEREYKIKSEGYDSKIKNLEKDRKFKYIPCFVELDCNSTIILKDNVDFFTYIARKQ